MKLRLGPSRKMLFGEATYGYLISVMWDVASRCWPLRFPTSYCVAC
jgi:hypothetical protein